MKYLVTGGAGFIGSHLVDRLLAEGHSIIVVDNFSFGKEENLSKHRNNPHLIISQKSICEEMADIFELGLEAVFHLAALPRVQYSIAYPKEAHETNCNGTFNVLNYCRLYGVKRFIFSSSSSVYGDQDIPYSEEMKPRPLSPYAFQKVIGEGYCSLFSLFYGLETISLRYFNVIGPRQSPNGGYACLIPRVLQALQEKKSPIIFGDGTQTRDFVYVSDVVEANIHALQTQNKECFGKAINIGTGREISVNDVTSLLLSYAKSDCKPHHTPPVIEPKRTCATIERAKKLLQWEPFLSFEDGLRKTYENFFDRAL